MIKNIWAWLCGLFGKKKAVGGLSIPPAGYMSSVSLMRDKIGDKSDYVFRSISKEEVKNGRGTMFRIYNPKDCVDFDWLIGRTVSVDAIPYMVLQVISDNPQKHKAGGEIYIRVAKVKRSWS